MTAAELAQQTMGLVTEVKVEKTFTNAHEAEVEQFRTIIRGARDCKRYGKRIVADIYEDHAQAFLGWGFRKVMV